MLGAVADDGFEDDVHPEFVEPPGQEQGIGVLAKGRQELGADSYDLSIHGYQCKPNPGGVWNFAAGAVPPDGVPTKRLSTLLELLENRSVAEELETTREIWAALGALHFVQGDTLESGRAEEVV
jgi:hypothetical protein